MENVKAARSIENMIDTERVFSSGQVQRAADLTYRQINDWDSRGALAHDRSSERDWRKYSAREIFVLMVCNEMHRRFGIPIQRLSFVRRWMLQEGVDHLQAAIKLMTILGVGVWLMTDLEETFILDSELEFDALMQDGFFSAAESKAFVSLKVNPLVNRLLNVFDLEGFDEQGRGHEILKQLQAQVSVSSPGELEVLKAIRNEDLSKGEVTLDNGEVRIIRTTEHPDASSILRALLDEHPFQKVTIQKRDGQIVSIERGNYEESDRRLRTRHPAVEEAPHGN